MPVVFYTDGACSGNPGPGGWAVVLPDRTVESRGYRMTTNNRMELMAAIRAMELAGKTAVIVFDSRYVVSGHNEWLDGWIAAGWKGGKVKNSDLWKRVAALRRPGITFKWVRGHAGNPLNEKADACAVSAMHGTLVEDEGF